MTERVFRYRKIGSEEINLHIAAYGTMVTNLISDGFTGYMLSFLFSSLGTKDNLIKARMTEAITRAYSDSVTFVVRYPTKCPTSRLPIWIACLDVPVLKLERQRAVETGRNNGLHAHAVVLIPPDSRLRVPFDRHLVERRERYRQRPIIDIGCESIKDNPAYVTDYVLKGLRRPRMSRDDVLVLPRTRCELSR